MKQIRSLALTVFVVLVCLTVLVFGEEFRSPVVFKSDVDFDTGSNLKIQGTKVTSSAAELNIMDGVTVSAAQINSAAGGSTASLTPTLVSNDNAKVFCSNLVVTTGGTVTLPSASLASAALPATVANSTLISNANLKVYGLTLEVKSGGTVTLPSASIASTALPATISDSTTVSNQNLFVYGSNITAKTGGTVTLAGTVILSGLPTSTNGFSVTGSAWNSNGYVCVWSP